MTQEDGADRRILVIAPAGDIGSGGMVAHALRGMANVVVMTADDVETEGERLIDARFHSAFDLLAPPKSMEIRLKDRMDPIENISIVVAKSGRRPDHSRGYDHHTANMPPRSQRGRK